MTYDQFGGYGHPDHIQAHRVATYAAHLAAVPSYRLDLGEPWDIAKIYWGAMSESRMRASLRALREAGDTTTFEGMDPDGPLPHFVTPDDAARRDGRRHRPRRSQDGRDGRAQDADHPRRSVLRAVQQPGDSVWGTEFFRLAKGTRGPVGDEGLETDLFAGL